MNDRCGITDSLFNWLDKLQPLLRYINGLDVTQLRLQLDCHGSPHLLVWNDAGEYDFVEVKSPTDHLGAQQLHWLEFFQTIGVRGKVVRVVWKMF